MRMPRDFRDACLRRNPFRRLGLPPVGALMIESVMASWIGREAAPPDDPRNASLLGRNEVPE
jgi:hypothetical protein